MLQITNPILKRLMLEQIVEQIDGGGLDDLLAAGFSAEFLDMLRHRPARDLIKISEFPGMNLRVSLQEQTISNYLNRLDAMRRDSHMREYFIRHGAPVRVMCDFFRMSADDVRALRAQLLPPQEKQGRNRMPAPEVRDRIHDKWHAISREHPDAPPRERMYRLHQAFPDIRIDALCRSLNEFNDEPMWQVSEFGTIQ